MWERIGVALFVLTFAGCVEPLPANGLAEADSGTPKAVGTSVGAEPSKIIGEIRHEGRMMLTSCLVLCVYDQTPMDKGTFPTEFPSEYRVAVVEMVWSPTTPASRVLDLMIHAAGVVDNGGMVAEAVGPSPLRLELGSDAIRAGRYDVVGFVPPGDVMTPVVVDQEFVIRVTFFDGPAPEGFTAT